MKLVLARQGQHGMKAVAVLNARPAARGMSIAVSAYVTKPMVMQRMVPMTKPTVARKRCVKAPVTMMSVLAVAVV